MEKRVKVPAIVSDVDGVLVLDANAIKYSPETLKYLRLPLNKIDSDRFHNIESQLPLICLTNAGGVLEQAKANSINKLLKLEGEFEQLTYEHVIVNSTPLRILKEQLQDKTILMAGIGDLGLMAQSFGFNKYITITEYSTMFHYLVPNSANAEGWTEKDMLNMRAIIKERLNILDDSIFNDPLPVSAMIIWNDVYKWDECAQIMCDLTSSEDGTIADKFPEHGTKTKHIPIYACSNDLVYAGNFRLPRIACGGAVETFKHMYKLLYGLDPEITYYGKPEISTFRYTEQYVREKWNNFEISNFYMIGDNPTTDIKGANRAGWTSILVKSGIFKGDENDVQNPANFVVNDLKEAIQLIFKLEGINCEL